YGEAKISVEPEAVCEHPAISIKEDRSRPCPKTVEKEILETERHARCDSDSRSRQPPGGARSSQQLHDCNNGRHSAKRWNRPEEHIRQPESKQLLCCTGY